MADLTSDGAVAAVVAGRRVGPGVVQRIYAIADHHNRRALVFSVVGYSRRARSWATKARVGLLSLKNAGFRPVNNHARWVVHTNLRAGGAGMGWSDLIWALTELKVGESLSGAALDGSARWSVSRLSGSRFELSTSGEYRRAAPASATRQSRLRSIRGVRGNAEHILDILRHSSEPTTLDLDAFSIEVVMSASED